MKIVDGQGSGTLAGVNEDNELKVNAVSSDIAVISNQKLRAYHTPTQLLSVGAATATNILYIKNNLTVDLILDGASISFDGGSTNFDKMLKVTYTVPLAAPSANNTSFNPGPLNGASPTLTTVDAQKWDEVGSGMTISSDVVLSEYYVDKGYTSISIPSKFIMSPGDALAVKVECSEACEVSANFFIHY